MSETNDKTKYIAALDVGTTTVRCFIYDNNVQIVGKASDKVNIYLKFLRNENYTYIVTIIGKIILIYIRFSVTYRLNYCIPNQDTLKSIQMNYGEKSLV